MTMLKPIRFPILLALGLSAGYCAQVAALPVVRQCSNTQEFEQKSLLNTAGRHKADYLKYDFSGIWVNPKTHYLGALGTERYRMNIALLSAKKDQTRPGLYNVSGNIDFKGNKSAFTGSITLRQIRSYAHFDLGVDDEMRGKIRDQGVLIADYEFRENSNQTGNGVFTGVLAASWYVDKQGKIRTDDYIPSDSYANSQFYGTWASYRSGASKPAVWGQYRIPCVNDLDIGAGDFSVNPKYKKNGW